MMTFEQFKSEVAKATQNMSTYEQTLAAHEKVNYLFRDEIDFDHDDNGVELDKFKFALQEMDRVEKHLDTFCAQRG